MRKYSRKRRILLLLPLIILSGIGYLFFYDPPYSGLVTLPDHTLAFAHRGFGNLAPDNSLVAAKRAMNAGMDGVDVDGQQSSDGEFVIFHDLSVDRLTSGTGRVSSKTLAELRKLDLAEKFGKGFTGAYVTTFEEFLTATKGKGILMVELKVTGLGDTGLEKRAAEIVAKHGAYEQVYFSSFNPFVLHRLKRIDPQIRTALIFMDTNWNAELTAEIKPGDEVNLPWILRQEWARRAIRKIIKPDLLSVNVEVDDDTIQELLAKNWPIFLWTIDDEEGLRTAIQKQPYGIISDEPLLLQSLIKETIPSR